MANIFSALSNVKGLTGAPIIRPTGQVDFGGSEVVAKLFGRPQNNLIPGQQSTASLASLVNPSVGSYIAATTPYSDQKGQVLGDSTTSNRSVQPQMSAQSPMSTQPAQSTNAAVDLSNPAKKTDYARSQGFGSWDEYQNAINQQSQQAQPDLYGEIGRAFDDVLGGLGGQQSGMESQIRSAAETQRSGINEQLGYGLQNLDTQRGGVRTTQANTMADLAQNLRDQAKNINLYLGVRSPGGSSASDAASFALQKVFGRERAGVQRQGMQQLGDIDTAETNLRAKASEMVNGVETWANTQLADIGSKFNDLRNNIGTMKGQMRAQAVEALYNQYNQVMATREAYAMNIQKAAQDRLAQLNNLKLELQNSSQFDPQAMTYSEYGFNPGNSYSAADSDAFFNPLAMARRRQQNQL